MQTLRRFCDPIRQFRYFVIASLLISGVLFIYLHINLNSTYESYDVTTTGSTSNPTTTVKTNCHILIMVLSTPRNSENRDMLRWNSYLGYPWLFNRTDVDFRYIFILGKTGDEAVNDYVKREAKFYGDIAIGDFRDAYDNLSEKVIWGFHHALQHFDFRYCIKVDEDSFLNMSYLASFLSTVDPKTMPTFYAGKPREGTLAVPKHGKFKVKNWENGEIDEYVKYNLGGGYILSDESMSKILKAHRSKAIEPIVWEDVYIGMLAYLVGMKPTRILHYYVSKFYPFCTDVKSILLHHTQPSLQARMLNHYHKTGIYCPKDMSEEEVMKLIKSYDIVDWRDFQ